MTPRIGRPPSGSSGARTAPSASIEAAAWIVAGGVPRRPLVLVQVIAAWVVMLILAVAGHAAHRIDGGTDPRAGAHARGDARRDRAAADAERDAAKSSRGRSTCRSPSRRSRRASRASCPATASGSRCSNENGQEFQTYTARVHEEERRARPRPDVMSSRSSGPCSAASSDRASR